MPKIRHAYTRNFTIVTNQLAQDSSLSYKARGLFLYLWSLPDDWEISLKELERHSEQDGQTAVRTAVTELQHRRYISFRRVQAQGTGKFTDTEWTLTDNPSLDFPHVDNPSLDFPHVDNPSLDNHSTLKDCRSKDQKKRRTRKEENPSVSTTVETSPQPAVTGTWIVETYNAETPPNHPKHTLPLSPARLKRANDYARRFPDPTFWRQVFAEVWRSPWMCGERANQGHRAIKRDLFWMLQTQQGGGQENCVKVYEGNYRDDSSHVGPGSILDNSRTAHNVAASRRGLKRMMEKYGLTEEDFEDDTERHKTVPGDADRPC